MVVNTMETLKSRRWQSAKVTDVDRTHIDYQPESCLYHDVRRRKCIVKSRQEWTLLKSDFYFLNQIKDDKSVGSVGPAVESGCLSNLESRNCISNYCV